VFHALLNRIGINNWISDFIFYYKVAFMLKANGRIMFSKASFASLRGLLQGPAKAYTIDEMNQTIERQISSLPLSTRKASMPKLQISKQVRKA
jgi:hypothetical protein